MIGNLGITLEKIERKAQEKGSENRAKEIAINAIEMAMDNEVIIKLTGLSDEKINKIRKEIII